MLTKVRVPDRIQIISLVLVVVGLLFLIISLLLLLINVSSPYIWILFGVGIVISIIGVTMLANSFTYQK